MKKIIPLLSLILALSTTSALAIDLNKIADAVDSVSSQNDQKNGQKKPLANLDENLLNGVVSKVEERINKITDKLEGRVTKYEKKFDEYEGKIDKAEKATDRIIKTIESVDASKIQQIAMTAKHVAIGVAVVFLVLIVLLVLVLVQLVRVGCLLKRMKDK
jgi:hypothetical protein